MSGRRGRGEGSIYESNGRWAARVSLGWENGKRRRKVLYGKTRREVAEKLTAVLRAQQQGVPISTQKLTVATYLSKWIVGMAGNVRGSTYRRYEQLVRVHLVPRLGRIPLSRLAPADLSAVYAGMVSDGLAPRTAGHAHRVLGRALRDAEVAGLAARNVARLTRPPRVPEAEMRALDADQARNLLRAARGDRLYALYRLALATGAREGELLALKWPDVDVSASVVRIRRALSRTPHGPEITEVKTPSSRRQIPIGGEAIEALRAHRKAQTEERLRVGSAWQDNDLVFSTTIGTPIDGGDLLRAHFYPLLTRAGLPRVRFHDLRHTAATLLLAAGTHPKIVAERLGHSTPTVTLNVYSHVTPTMQREAAATLDRVLGA